MCPEHQITSKVIIKLGSLCEILSQYSIYLKIHLETIGGFTFVKQNVLTWIRL